ncbi:tripartite tricarboxylate transporter TctB family protein [Ruegeria sp. HKCCD8929]|uniref:tripartite tricarboxylate transporter TctB family protein n=1 Tax=Ruegeria sp. HKCCD8929 TaxID=2683006 RepID=UPI001489B565|nr:tripartite tricarboxylate transporter TctB family protein [Ruegeria sp. HKCCD8929]
MTFQTDRIVGLIVATLGLMLLFVIFPIAIEDVEGGSIQPDTLPNAVAGFLVICGVLLALKPGESCARDPQELMMVLLYIVVMALGLFAMSRFGFVIVSPVLALAIMLLFGERRPFWLALGCVGMPAIIWLLVVQILERPLP